MNNDEGFGQNITWDIPLLDSYDHVFMKNTSSSKGMNTRFFDAINWSIFKVIRQSDDKVVIVNGWAYLSDWLVFFAAKFYGKKVWMRSEMPWNQEELKPKSLKRRLKFFIFKYFLFKYMVDKFLYIGSQNRIYYQMHGIDDQRLIYAPYSVDNDGFTKQIVDGIDTRQKWGIGSNQVVILYSGKLINKKRPMDLLMAFHKLKKQNVILFYMGDGPLRFELETYVNTNSIKNVIISGFINQSEVSSIYSMADLFVMCSGVGETWGLSVNEAMNFGLPIIISETCGCSFDLIEDGKNGFIYKEGDVEQLKDYMDKFVNNISDLNFMGANSKKKIYEFSHQVTSNNIVSNIDAALL